MSKERRMTWTAHYRFSDPPITAKEAMPILKQKRAPFLERARLWFVPSQYSFDGDSVIRYKQLGKKLYIFKKGTKITPEVKP